MVFSYHSLGIGRNRLGIQNEYIESFLWTFLNGKTGVSIFFVLSGFLITYIILSEIRQTGTLNLVNFYLRRVLRIWPLYFLIIFLVFIVLPLVNHFFKLGTFSQDIRPAYYVTFLSNFDVLRIYEMKGYDFLPSTITWSVAIEEQFYLFWPLLFFFSNPDKYKFIFIAIIGFAFCFRMFNYNNTPQLYFHSFSAMFDLSIGGAAAYLSLYNNSFREKFLYLSDLHRTIIIGLGLSIMYVNALTGHGYISLLFTVLQVLFFAFIILDQCFNQSSRIKFSNSRLLTDFGKYTYGMYMIHPLVLRVITTILTRFTNIKIGDLLNPLLCFCLGLPLTVWLARLSYVYLERNFLLMKERFSPFVTAMIKGRN